MRVDIDLAKNADKTVAPQMGLINSMFIKLMK